MEQDLADLLGAEAVAAASQYIEVEQLCLSPQCGFSSTVQGNALSYDQEVAKLELIVQTAGEVWG